jgi:hypothetical protein
MKKLSKLKKPKLPKVPAAVKEKLRRPKAAEERVQEALQNVPRITNDTVTEHREEVLGQARKYIYPLRHSRHHAVQISVSLFVIVVIVLLAYCSLALYKFQDTSGFMYGVSRVVPFPVAKAGSSWVSYDSYLFELKRNMHYYQTQQQADFSTKDGQAQLKRLKQQALDQVVRDAYVKQLAKKYHVSVSGQAVDNEVSLVRAQNRLGSNDRVFRNVLNQFWGWSENDFKRELRQQLLQQAVVAKLDTATNQRAQAALTALQQGAEFADVARQYSDDTTTSANGGQYAGAITANDPNLAPQLTQALFQLQAGQTSAIINTGYTLEIVKVLTSGTGSVTAAHIQFTFQPITTYTAPLAKVHPAHDYIKP